MRCTVRIQPTVHVRHILNLSPQTHQFLVLPAKVRQIPELSLGPLPAVRMVGVKIISFGGGAPKLLRGKKGEPWKSECM